MPEKLNTQSAVIGIDIGKNSFHVVGHHDRGAIVLREKWSRGQVEFGLPTCRLCERMRRDGGSAELARAD